MLRALKDVKARGDGERINFRAQALRFWEVGGLRMALVGDESALVRIEMGDIEVAEGSSYKFQNAVVRTYPGGWHSVEMDDTSTVVELGEPVVVTQSEEYIERTYRILAGIQRKKGRAAGRLPPWRHAGEEVE
jgi:hypothetical protein